MNPDVKVFLELQANGIAVELVKNIVCMCIRLYISLWQHIIVYICV